MDALVSGIYTLFNGLLSFFGYLADPLIIAGVIMGIALVWLAVIEIEELNRQGSKPEVGKH